MNYLAHCLLSQETPQAIVGGLLGDFVKGTVQGRFDEATRRAIVLHRRIDRYTDEHELVRASRQLVSVKRRRFAGIMVDVFYDHFLARHWHRYSPIPLRDFTRHVYTALNDRCESLPERLRLMLPRMAADDWLASYGELWAVDAALAGIARRLRRKSPLPGGASELSRHYRGFESHFLTFFPEVLRYAEASRATRAAAHHPSRTGDTE